MSTTLCDPEAFYPFRSLVEGPLNDPHDLEKIERFVRSVVLHDECLMTMVPFSDPGEEQEWAPEEIAAGGRSVIVAIGPVIDTYEQFDILRYGGRVTTDVEVPPELQDLAREFAHAGAGPYFDAYVEHIRSLIATVASGGSIVSENEFSERVISIASRIPENLFAHLDERWAQVLHAVDEGRIGLVVPPFTAVLLSRSARRDAIPQVLGDMKAELQGAREAIWQLIKARQSARTIAEADEIAKEFERAGAMMLADDHWPTFSPVRTLWQIGVAAAGGLAVGAIGGKPAFGAAVAAITQAANAVRNADVDFRVIFRAGAFDLARRVNRSLRDIPHVPELLRAHLTQGELESLGIG